MSKESSNKSATLHSTPLPLRGAVGGEAPCGESAPLLFDFGGTIDTAGCHWGKMLWHAYEQQHIPISEEIFRQAYVYAERTLGKNPIIQTGYTFRHTLEIKLRIEFEYLAAHGLVSPTGFSLASMQAAVLDDVYNKVKAITTHSRDVLQRLRQQHRLGLVSNFYGNIAVVLDEFGLADLFETVTESAVVGIRKPDPRIFQLAAESMGVKPGQTTVVGDSYTKDILPAHSIGCRTVWIKGEGWTDDEPETCVADRIITDLAQLTEA
ncbi:MAG: HAD family hydrolase [Prevotella sp.]|nr:HAD family hydrolase [Prevotella sp.]